MGLGEVAGGCGGRFGFGVCGPIIGIPLWPSIHRRDVGPGRALSTEVVSHWGPAFISLEQRLTAGVVFERIVWVVDGGPFHDELHGSSFFRESDSCKGW